MTARKCARLFLPNMRFLKQVVFALEFPIGMEGIFSQLNQRLKLFLFNASSLSLSFHRCQTCITCLKPSLLLVPLSFDFSRFLFPQISFTFNLDYLLPSKTWTPTVYITNVNGIQNTVFSVYKLLKKNIKNTSEVKNKSIRFLLLL